MHLRPTGRALLQLVGDAVKRGRHLAGALHRGHWGRRERPRRRLAFFTLTHEPTCSGAATRLASGKGYTFEGFVFTPSRQRLTYRRDSYEARYIARACALGRARVVYCFQSFKRGSEVLPVHTFLSAERAWSHSAPRAMKIKSDLYSHVSLTSGSCLRSPGSCRIFFAKKCSRKTRQFLPKSCCTFLQKSAQPEK